MHHAFGLGSRFYTTYLLSMSEANGISVRLKLCSGPKIPATDKFVRWAMSNTSMPSERSIPKSFTQEYVSQLGTTVYRSLSGGGSTSVMGCSDTLHTVSLSASRVIGLFYTVVFLLCDETIARAKLRSAVFRAISCFLTASQSRPSASPTSPGRAVRLSTLAVFTNAVLLRCIVLLAFHAARNLYCPHIFDGSYP